ncbi:hypothetical protein JVU11DRAFT_9807 [Chiua virens]|nr:hypothetical protein JVU11DRAFT_9807 [Chiua virens]
MSSENSNNGEAGFQEVEVDHRALVNILARYPGEFDVLRELIQNADDAEAKNVEIHFRTEDAEKPQLAGGFDISKATVSNNFVQPNWDSTASADGNKNSTKVGAFGVGFYSVLGKTDIPLVKSSNKSFQFVRGKDGKLQNQFVDCSPIPGTSIELELRTREPLPKLDNLARFLVSSVTFLTNIESASVYLDSTKLLQIKKECRKPQVQVPIPPYLTRTTSSKALTVESIQRIVQTITIDAAECTLPSEPTLSSVVDTADTIAERRGGPAEDHITHASQSVNIVLEANTVRHDLYIAAIDVNLPSDSEMSGGVESSIKRLPPSFKCKAVYFNPEQSRFLANMKYSCSHKTKHLAFLFSGLQGIAPDNEGPLSNYWHASTSYIQGQSTNQTTGIGLHISAHFLSTMERGSLSKDWNREVLKVGGLLARVVYEQEMHTASKSKNDVATKLGLSTMARFAFGSTVPHSGVSQILQDAFYSCCHKSKSPFPVVSAAGISDASDPQFRQSNKDLSFLKRYWVLHEDIKDHQRSQIIRRYNIPQFKFGDIVREFEIGVKQETMKSFFAWWDNTRKTYFTSDKTKSAAEKFCNEFASHGVIHIGHGVRMELKNIKYYILFPLHPSLSRPDTIYIDVGSGHPSKDAVEAFGWSQLSLLDWLEYAHAQAQQHTSNSVSGPDSDLGFRILLALVQFALVETLSGEQWNRIAAFMKDLKCIPTNKGLKTPGESYFEIADICKSLPIASESEFLSIPMTPVASKSSFEYRSVTPEHVRKVLAYIGVCQMMEWEEMVARLRDVASEETNGRLLHFLSVVCRNLAPSPLPSQWFMDLQVQKIFYSKSHGRVSATELYFPDGDLHKLKLPILALPQDIGSLQNLVHSSGSFPIERFIEQLGVRRYPPLKEVIDLAASNEPEVQKFALQYLLSNFDTLYSDYKSGDFAHIPFIPTQRGSLARLNEVFASPIWEKLGFELVSNDLGRNCTRLGVRDDPSVEMIIEHLKVPTTTLPDIEAAAQWFDLLYVHGKLPIQKLGEHLSTIPFVPVKNSSVSSSQPSSIDYISPKDCFIGSTDAKAHHRRVFSFVDFGQNGGAFLEHCGARKSPEPSNIARKICQGPERYLEALENNYELYLEDLDTIASHLESISNDDKQAMKKAPMFLACRNDEKMLLRADQVIISDWDSRDFGGDLFIVPRDSLESQCVGLRILCQLAYDWIEMYREMGSEFLRAYVQYDIQHIGYQAGFRPPFEQRQVIRRIKCFMNQRDNSTKTGVSFHNHGEPGHLEVKICEELTLKKTFIPSSANGKSERIVETKVKAGLEVNETDKSYTLWMVKGEDDSVELRNDIAVGLCHILLKTYRVNHVLLLASLFAMDDQSLDTYYNNEVKHKLSDTSKRVTVELPRIPFLSKVFGTSERTSVKIGGKVKYTVPPEHDVTDAVSMCAKLDPDGQPPSFNAPIQSRPGSVKHVSRCEEACKIMLKEKVGLRDEKTRIRFFVAEGALCQHPRLHVLQEFAELVADLARVFGLKPPATCHIFWKDTDLDLMAFNRDQKYIFFNLACYEREFHDKGVDKKKAATEWFLIMAHEMAHNITLNHDEYHGELTSRIAVEFFPAFNKQFCF